MMLEGMFPLNRKKKIGKINDTRGVSGSGYGINC
jgi:hypothetical protein